ncbi:hypothetical protein J3Q64DRAFT_1751821 [Phycomyces blakesleeanus]|uniref:Uncharacterized protein n=1 Tax=Phycomyces blakesleeanus TaxID=4837 RepID=A0ABR3ATN7_PHYBL
MKKTFNPGTPVAIPSTSTASSIAEASHENNEENSKQAHTLMPKKINKPDGIRVIPTAASNPDNVSFDLPILPSSSTFTISGKEDKPEKLKKKLKNFLDERQKTKSRAQSLWSYIDATNSFDQARFFQENAEQVFAVFYETCVHQIEKIKRKYCCILNT